MKRLFLALVVLAISTISAIAQNTLTKEYNFKEITSIEASSVFDIEVTKGKTGKVKIVYDEIFKDRIEVSYRQGTLKLSLEKTTIRLNSKNKNSGIKVYLQMPTIHKIDLSGASTLKAKGDFYAQREMEIELSGASSAKGLQAKGDLLLIDCSGASQLQMSGDFKKVDAELSGASKINYNGDSKELLGEFSGAVSASFEGDCEKTSIDCSGAANVTMVGETDNLAAIISGASKFKGEKYEAKNGYVEATGASNAQVRCTGELQIMVSRASKLTHYGNPKLTIINKDNNIKKGD